jgi:hypothetical protein
MQWGVLGGQCRDVWVRPESHQETHEIGVVGPHGVMQRRMALYVAQVWTAASLEQNLGNLYVGTDAGEVQRRVQVHILIV